MIFLDTGFIFALACRHDASHQRVRVVMEAYAERDLASLLLTTNHVVEETITLLRSRGHHDVSSAHDLAMRIGQRLFAGELARVHQASADEERVAFAYMGRYRDKRYSLTDCLSFVIMDAYGITEALSVDEDFTHRFTARPGPPSKK